MLLNIFYLNEESIIFNNNFCKLTKENNSPKINVAKIVLFNEFLWVLHDFGNWVISIV